MNHEQIAAEFDDALAEAYIQRALKQGKSEDDGFSDYLTKELGIRRPEKTDEVLKEVAAMQKQAIDNLIDGLVNALAEAAPAAPTLLPLAFNFAGNHVDALIGKIESSTNPKLKPVQKRLRTHKEDLLAELRP